MSHCLLPERRRMDLEKDWERLREQDKAALLELAGAREQLGEAYKRMAAALARHAAIEHRKAKIGVQLFPEIAR